MKSVVAQRNMHRRTRPGLPRRFDKPKYRQRNAIERCFGWLKECRRIATRYEKLASSFKAMVCVACIDRCLRANFSYKTPNLYYCLLKFADEVWLVAQG